MSYSIKGSTITLTRGDTFSAEVKILKPDGSIYVCQPGDQIRFALKQDVKETSPLILKEVPISTMRLILDPEDTKDLRFGNYIYDVQLTKADGTVSTFITMSKLILTEEVE